MGGGLVPASLPPDPAVEPLREAPANAENGPAREPAGRKLRYLEYRSSSRTKREMMYVDTGCDLGQNTGMGDSSPITPSPSESGLSDSGRSMLWIDGVGAYLVCLGERTTIGGPGRDDQPADVALLANLSGLHATIVRSREGYFIEAHSPVRIGRRVVDGRAYLNDGYEIELGSGVRLRFRLPSVLSMSAALEFVSDHRPTQSVDGVVLMEETCLLGSGPENHVRCRDWAAPVLLYRRDGELYCKSRGEVFVDGMMATASTPLRDGQIVSGADFSFRIEALRTRVGGRG